MLFNSCYDSTVCLLLATTLGRMNNKEIKRENLKLLIQERGFRAPDWRAIDVDPNYISRINNGAGELGDNKARQICSALNLPSDYFDVDRSNTKDQKAGALLPVPLIVLYTEYQNLMDGTLDRSEVKTMAVHPEVYTSSTFALEHEGEAMAGGARPINKGDRCVIDPAIEPKHGHIVAAYIASTDKYYVRTYIEESGEKSLLPANPAFESIQLCDEDKIIGVIKEVTWAPPV